MWRALAGFWARRTVLSITIIVGLLVSGAFTYLSLVDRDGFPALELPLVMVTAEHDAATPLEADATVGAPLTALIGELDEVLQVRTTSATNTISSIVFTSSDRDGTVVAKVIADAADAAGFDVIAMPTSIETIGFTVALSSPELSASELDSLAASLAIRLVESDTVLDATPSTNFDETGDGVSFGRIAQRDANGLFEARSVATIVLNKPSDLDTLTFSDEVTELLEVTLRAEGALPDHVTVTTIGDQAPATRTQIAGLETSLIQSLLIVAAMVLLLVSWRAAIVAALFVPTVMGGTILVLYLAGATLNTISMFGLLLVLGLFIDDIIVVVEAIEHERDEGYSGTEAVKRAVQRIGSADLMGSLTTIAVFGPLLFLPGLLGEFVIQLPMAVIIALTLSVVLALTAFSWLASVLVADQKPNVLDRVLSPISNTGGRVVTAARNGLDRFVGGYLRSKRLTTVAGAVGLLAIVGGIGVAANLDLDIFPSPDDAPSVSLFASFNDASSIGDAENTAAALEAEIVKVAGSDIERIVFFDVGVLGGSIQLDLAEERSATAGEIAKAIDAALEDFALASVTDAAGDPPPVAAFLADDPSELATLVEETPRFLTELPDTVFGSVAPTSILVSRWNNSLAAQAEIVLAGDTSSSSFLDNLGASAETDGLGVGILAGEVDTTDPLLEDQEDSFGAMGLVFIVSIVLIALLLVIQFRSVLLPGLILMAIPLALPLLFPGLLSVGADLSFFVMLGISALIGIAVNNSIMLIDYANQEVRSGAEPVPAILAALRVRFRPLVTAALTTVVGIYPLTTDPQFSGLAWTVIFGLISSTVLVVTVFPAYYVMVQTPRSAFARWRQARKTSSPVTAAS